MDISANRLAAPIALLSLVNDKPVEARSTVADISDNLTDERPDRQLLLHHEITITQQLAFISAYSDSPRHVMAICIDESAKDTLVFRIAVNSGDHTGLVEGLNSIAQILENEAKNCSRSENADILLKRVISLNRRRILCRLRSRHASFSRKAKNKPPLLDRLRVAHEALQQSALAPSTLQEISGEIDNLQRCFNQLEEMDTHQAVSPASDSCLSSLVKGLDTLGRHEQTLAQVPCQPGRWLVHDTRSLLDRVKKSGHYVDACSELLRAARRYTLFSKISVDLVNHQLSSATVNNSNLSTEQMVPQELLRRVSNHLSISIEKARDRMNNVLQERSRVHAEMQLVIFYELNPPLHRPRVICSSKSACYLCHLFLVTQGKYISPSTHGTLYTGWKWPGSGPAEGDMPEVRQLLPRLVSSVEHKLLESVRGTATRQPDRVESVVHLPVLTPSCLSIPSTRISTRTATPIHRRMNPRRSVRTLSRDAASVRQASPISVGTLETVSAEEHAKDGTGMQNHLCRDSPSASSTQHSGENLPVQLIRITKGQGMIHTFTKANRMLQVQAANINVHLECDTSTFGEDYSTQKFQLQLDWLDSTELDTRGASHAIQLGSCWDSMPVMDNILFTPGGLLLRRGATILQLQAVK